MNIPIDLPIRRSSRCLALFAAFVAVRLGFLAVPQAQAAEQTQGTVTRLACVGDSITAGYALRDPAHDAYPTQLARLLGSEWEVRNFGVSGATLMRAGGMPYDKQSAHAAALEWKPDAVVIALGTNDAKAENIDQHPDDFIPSYHALIAEFRAANPQAKVFICLPPPVVGDAMNIRKASLEQDILPRIGQIAKDENVPLIDLFAPLQSEASHFPDLIHPDPEGAGQIARIVYGELMLATQPPAKALNPAINTAVVPVSRLEHDSYNWWTRHVTELAVGPGINPEVVLIGDSITHFWGGEPRDRRRNGPKAWATTFGDRRVLNLGFGWDRTQNVLWRLDHGEFDGLHPKLVIVNIGTNNFSGTPNARANTPEEVAAGVRAICERIHPKSPDTHLLVMGVLPRGWPASDGFRAPIAALNAILAQTIPSLPNARFLDIGGRFLNADGSMPRELMPDTVHPSEKGYTIWGRAIIESGLLPPVAGEASPTAPKLSLLRPGTKIVFVGDSITDGGRARTGSDYNHTMGQSYAYILAATLGERLAERNLTFINRGNGGDRALDLKARWQTDVLDLKPDVLSILVGVNDTFWAKGETLEQFEATYDALLRQTIAALPNTKIILGEPFVLPAGWCAKDYANLRAEVEKRAHVVVSLAEKYKLPIVRYQQAFDDACKRAPADHWSWDGVHPHYAGHGLMADEWIKVADAAE